MPALSRVLTVFLSTGLSEYALMLVRVAIASRTESWRFLSVFPEEVLCVSSGASHGTRTHDLLITNELLYQLS